MAQQASNSNVQFAQGASVASGFLGFKGNMAAAKQAKAAAEYNAKLAENERKEIAEQKAQEEKRLRIQSERIVGTQRQMTAAAGVQMTGSALTNLADTYFATEQDALGIQQASTREQAAKTACFCHEDESVHNLVRYWR